MTNEQVAWMETYKGEPNNLDWDKSWSNETIALFDKLETQIRQQQAEIVALKKQNDDYWTMIEILRQRLRGNPLQDRLDEIASGVIFGETLNNERK